MVGITCPPGWHRVNWCAKIWNAMNDLPKYLGSMPPSPGSDSPASVCTRLCIYFCLNAKSLGRKLFRFTIMFIPHTWPPFAVEFSRLVVAGKLGPNPIWSSHILSFSIPKNSWCMYLVIVKYLAVWHVLKYQRLVKWRKIRYLLLHRRGLIQINICCKLQPQLLKDSWVVFRNWIVIWWS
jgi:hypothetical protein